jgi:predicted ferric reductase
MRYTRTQASLWLAAYVLVVSTPLLAALAGPLPAARGFVVELGVALGFIALGMFWAQFALTGRFRAVAAAFGMDAMLQFHRQAGIAAYVLVLAHPLLLIAAQPDFLEFLDPRTSFTRAAALYAVIGAATLLIVTTLHRLSLGLPYEWWRRVHAALSAFVVFVGLVHVLRVAYYMADPLRQALVLAGTSATLGLLAYTRYLRPYRLGRRPWRVALVRALSGDTWSVVLEPVGHGGIAHRAGQFAWVSVGPSPLQAEQHPFTIASAAAAGGPLEFAVRELGDFTSSIGTLTIGEKAFVDAPHGAFVLPDDASRPLFLFAGGIGISPMMSMLRTLAQQRDARRVTLFYASGDAEHRPFSDELEPLGGQLELRVVAIVERPPPDWRGEAGRLDHDTLMRLLPAPDPDGDYLICGPDPMMDAVEAHLLECGVAPDRIDSERFNIA